MRQLTKLLLAASVVLALASCNKSVTADIPAYGSDEIVFGTDLVLVETKAFSESTNDNLQAGGFNVAAVIDADHSAMFNKAVAYANGVYSVPGEHHYWPKTGTMSFYGVYPKTQAVSVDSGVATLSYTQNADTDLIAAKAAAVSKTDGEVVMAFDHILSQLSIKVQGEETTVDYKLFSLTLTAPDGGTYAYADGSWTPSATTADYPVYSNESGMAVSTSAMTAVGSAMSFVPGDVKLRARWTCYNKGTSIIVNEKDVTIDVTLAAGKSTALSLTLPFNGTGLTFSSTVGSWLPDPQSSVVKYKPETIKARFTVDDNGTPDDPTDDRVVEFAKGNLFWNGEEFSCEANQYDYPTTRDASHVGHLYNSKDARVAYATDYYAANTEFGITPATTDKCFAADGGVFEGFTVLSVSEWRYVLSHSIVVNPPVTKAARIVDGENALIEINGVNCGVLMPDGFSGTVKTTYTAAEWTEAEKSGLVALPLPGWFDGSFHNSGTTGRYWTNTGSWYVHLSASNVTSAEMGRANGMPVRLVKVVQEKRGYKPELVNGVFTVNDSGKKVKFTKGNLFWNADEFRCEANQYDYPSDWDNCHADHFGWASTVTDAINTSTSKPTGDTFFAADGGVGGVFEGFTVLSDTEWSYLISNAVAKNSSSKNTIVINGKNCLVLKPDGFTGTVADSYSAAEWAEAEKSGLVALPFAGYRDRSKFYDVGSYGRYSSSTLNDSDNAWYASFYSDGADMGSSARRLGYSVRLVKVVE